MKKIIAGLVVVGGIVACPVAMAESQTVSVGYAHAKIQDVVSLNGFNLQYRYEWDSPLSIIGSFSYMTGDDRDAYHDARGEFYKTDFDAKYTSLLAGPAYRINDYVSVYGLLGVAYTKISGTYEWRNNFGASEPDGHLDISDSRHTTKFAYAAGVVINPMDNLSVGIGYEGSDAGFYKSNKSINGFNVGIGWRF